MIRTNRRTTSACVLLCLMVQGCASPGQAVTQTIRIEAPGCARLSCELSNDHGRWQLARTPGEVTLTTSHEPLKVSCRPDNGAPFSFAAPSSLPPMSSKGSAVGGAIGGVGIGTAFGTTALTFIPAFGVIVLLSGAAVGATAGSALESSQRALHYPDLITIPMACPATGEAGPQVGLRLGLGISGLSPAQAREAGLGERDGVLVTSVVDGSPAAAAGLRSGDIILSAAGQSLGDTGDMADVVALAPGVRLTLKVWRDGRTLELVLTRPTGTP